jgi:hypothetical protein
VRDLGVVLVGGVLAAAIAGACTCAPVNYPVSSPPAAAASHRRFHQSETSMVRIDLPPNRPSGQPASRLVVGYNDATDAVVDAGANCWRYPGPASLDGWATSDTFGGPWARQPQLPISDSLRRAGVNARHGDPWLAAWSSKTAGVNGVVLYVSVAQQGLARIGPPFFLVLTRSRDDGATFEDGTVVLGPMSGVPDGPKVAISGDGLLALVAWAPGGLWQYKLVWNLDAATMHSSPGAITFDPRANADPPDPTCTSVSQFRHPHVAAGRSTFYIAGEFTYSGCNGGSKTRIEVHRNSTIGLAFGAPWQRILSAVAPASQGSVARGLLNAQNIVTPPRFGTEVDRGDILPALAVGQDEEGEYVIAVTEQVQAGTAADEAHRERLIQWRVPGADHCDAAGHRADRGTCGLAVPAQEIEAITTPGDFRDTRRVASRVGLWASKPAVFTGKVPDGTVDPRVGLIWYAQPYKGRLGVSDEMRARTVVEAAISNDGGRTYSGPFSLTAATEGDGIFEDRDTGPYFYPCDSLCIHYYGEYVSGAFQFADPSLIAIVGAWGDSREGCTSQSVETQHQHVWAGALRGKRR